MAKLEFKYATMNSGKSIDLIRTAYNYEETGKKVIVAKPLIDTKDNEYISSRVGLKRKADYLIAPDENVIELLQDNLDDVKCIFIDEAQFLTKNQIDELFLMTKVYDIPVICYGLRVNFKMESFEGSKRLLELAEILDEIKTMCDCNYVARFVGRKVNNEFVTDGEEVVIDGAENVEYVPLCGACYLQKVKKIDFTKYKRR